MGGGTEPPLLLPPLQAQCKGELQGRPWARLATCKTVVCKSRYKARPLRCSRGCNLKQCTSASPAVRMAPSWHQLQAGFRLSPRPRSADQAGWRLKPGSSAQLLTSSQVNAQVCTPCTAKATTRIVSSCPYATRLACRPCPCTAFDTWRSWRILHNTQLSTSAHRLPAAAPMLEA